MGGGSCLLTLSSFCPLQTLLWNCSRRQRPALFADSRRNTWPMYPGEPGVEGGRMRVFGPYGTLERKKWLSLKRSCKDTGMSIRVNFPRAERPLGLITDPSRHPGRHAYPRVL